MCSQLNDIRQSFSSLRVEKRLRHREIAKFLKITEAELIDAHVGVSKLASMKSSPHLARATRLKNTWFEMLSQFEALGKVLSLTRNEYGVLEKVGIYQPVSMQGDIGLVLGTSIDLRLFYKHWEFGYAFEEGKGEALQRSFQFFDEFGVAVHKVFLMPESDHDYFDELIEKFSDPHQDPGIQIQDQVTLDAPTQQKEPYAFSMETFREDWRELKDTHDFHSLIKRYGLSRLQALQAIGSEFANKLTKDSMRRVFELAKNDLIPLMIFVGNRGAIQIHHGVIHRLVEAKSWFNILDPGFNLHLDINHISNIWLVRKPTQDGIITSMELLDDDGQMVAFVFGERTPGQPEMPGWRQLIEGVLEEQGNIELCELD